MDWSKAKRQFRYMLLLTSSHSVAEPTNTHLNPYTFFFDSLTVSFFFFDSTRFCSKFLGFIKVVFF